MVNIFAPIDEWKILDSIWNFLLIFSISRPRKVVYILFLFILTQFLEDTLMCSFFHITLHYLLLSSHL